MKDFKIIKCDKLVASHTTLTGEFVALVELQALSSNTSQVFSANTWTEAVEHFQLTKYTRPQKPTLIVVPKEISNWKAKTILEIEGLLTTVETIINNLEGAEGIAVRNAWRGGAPFSRNSLTVDRLSTQLGLTKEQIDNMFIRADTLKV